MRHFGGKANLTRSEVAQLGGPTIVGIHSQRPCCPDVEIRDNNNINSAFDIYYVFTSASTKLGIALRELEPFSLLLLDKKRQTKHSDPSLL